MAKVLHYRPFSTSPGDGFLYQREGSDIIIIRSKPRPGSHVVETSACYTKLRLPQSEFGVVVNASSVFRLAILWLRHLCNYLFREILNRICGGSIQQNINDRRCYKYLRLKCDVNMSINKKKYREDTKWDELKGYTTNRLLPKDEINRNYNQLCPREKAFGTCKNNLMILLIIQRLRHKIQALMCFIFCTYKFFKESDWHSKTKIAEISPVKAIDIAKMIFRII